MASTTTLNAAVAVLLLLNLIVSSSAGKAVAPPSKHHPHPHPHPHHPPSKHHHGGHHLTCGQVDTGACVGLVGELMHWPHAGSPEHGLQCCHSIAALVEFEVAKCLCASFRGRFLHLKIDVGIFLTTVFNHCGKQLPNNFQCA